MKWAACYRGPETAAVMALAKVDGLEKLFPGLLQERARAFLGFLALLRFPAPWREQARVSLNCLRELEAMTLGVKGPRRLSVRERAIIARFVQAKGWR